MNFLFDNNLSPLLAEAIAALSRSDGRVKEVAHLRSRFAPNTPDEAWLAQLASEGRWCVVSIDQFRKTVAERELTRRHGLSVFVLDKQWADKQFWDKSARLVAWWPTILDVAAATTKSAYRVPYRRQGQKALEQIRA